MEHKMTHPEGVSGQQVTKASSCLPLPPQPDGALEGWAHLSDFRSIWELSQTLLLLAHEEQ